MADPGPRRRNLFERLQVGIPAILLAAAVGLRLAEPPMVESLTCWVFDGYNRFRPRPYEDVPVRIADIDEESLSRLGQWPWPRTLLARLTERLSELGASAVAFDILFAEPDRTSPKLILPLWRSAHRGAAGRSLEAAARGEASARLPDHDRLFAKALEATRAVAGFVLLDRKGDPAPVVKATFAWSGEDHRPYIPAFTGAVRNLPEIEDAAAGAGCFTAVPDPDGVIRRTPLVFRIGETVIPSLTLEALRVAQGASTILVKAAGGSGEASFGAQTGISRLKVGAFEIPTDAIGRIWVYYTRPEPRRFIPIWKILEKDFDPAALEGAIVFVGTSASGLKDQRATPLNPAAAGVEIHAQVAEQILLGRFLNRPDWAPGAEALFLVFFGGGLILLLRRVRAGWGASLAAASVGGAWGISWLLFTRWSRLVDPLVPSLGVLAVYGSSSLIGYLQSERDRRRVRGAFSRYLSPVLVEQLAAHPDKLRLGGETRRITVHFCDIQGFTTMSEWYDPQGLILFLNRFLTPMTEIVLKHRGSIDKYIGDCIMAYWNAPLDDPDHAANACRAVLEMHARLDALNAELRVEAETLKKEFHPIRLRTGLNTGDAIVGNMGSEQRFDYSVLGDDVNVASRLEGANKFFGTFTMAGETTFHEAAGAVEGRELGLVRVVGKAHPMRVYNLLALRGQLSEEWGRAMPLYDEGRALFGKRSFEEANRRFEEVLRIVPKDGPSGLYQHMAAEYAAIPPPDDWDGVFNLTAK